MKKWLAVYTVVAMSMLGGANLASGEATIVIDTPMPPPDWALLQRELLDANTAACKKFFAKYFDERGYLQCVERWGGDDGPDDAIENCNDWPILHALGADDIVLRMYKKAWEGHLRQYTEAKTTHVPFAKEGMYYKEFPVMFDWLHNGEGVTVFNLQGLSDPNNIDFQKRVRRFAGFYMNEDPGAPNYDPKHKIIRSMFNGSRGPLMRKATGLDWAGDPIEIKGRFKLGHGEESYEQMVAHFKDYNDIVGDHPQNLLATSLALNAYMLTGDDKYKRWLLAYVDAWRQRMIANDYIIPSNIGLDGKIGGETDDKWYGGVYGWGFTVVVPQDGSLAHRNTIHKGFTGFMNAYMLTGDDKYLDPWRKQIDKINSNAKPVDGEMMYPRMYGDEGWYHYLPEKYDYNAMAIYYLSMKPSDLRLTSSLKPGQTSISLYRDVERISTENDWRRYLAGQSPKFPEQSMRRDFARIRSRIEEVRNDETTPDTRLADDPMHKNPCSVRSLIHLMLGGIHPEHQGSVLHCGLRYFDPIRRRAGIPNGVAALIEKLTGDQVQIAIVNTNQIESRTVVVQAGGYAEHNFTRATNQGKSVPVNSSQFTLRLAPGCGGRITINMQRYANQPTLRFPWDR